MREITARPMIVAAAVVAASALVSGLSLFSLRAVAVVNTVTIVQQPGVLKLTSNLSRDEVLDLAPGDPVYWQIGADLTQDLTGSLVLEIRKTGDLATNAHGLIVAIERCSEPWLNLESTPSCGEEHHFVLVATPVDDNSSNSAVFDLAGITEAHGKYLLVTLSLNAPTNVDDEDLMSLTGEVGIGLTAAGDGFLSEPGSAVQGSLSADSRATLAMTGIDALALFLVAVGVLGLGAVFSLLRRFGPKRADAQALR
ncbi:hypothetical protein [Cryobacterium serini]|uniref:Uncharacterized protein n=1 Tax=Cryobacterium serini TaxID=1259201 RepID=A0A4R9BQQ4_9MICO|nr:hypothetical protein [Cryobacterium serini]TFD88922.1 hypothetical protein E3T51_06235 [Cryobacterium serini]